MTKNVIALCNQKGGVGKTTVSINLGAALADQGQRVLLIDLDPQGHLTEGVGLQQHYLEEGPNLYSCLTEASGCQFGQLVRRSAHEPLAVIPSTYQLMLAEQALFMARNREHKLKALLTQVVGDYDWILLDCPPQLGNLTDNALNAARKVIIPIQAEATSVRALELLFDQIESVEQGLGIKIEVVTVIPNLVQDSSLSKRILGELRGAIPSIAPFELRKRVLLQAAWEKGRSIFAYEPASRDERQTRDEIIESYRQLAQFVMQRVREVRHEQ